MASRNCKREDQFKLIQSTLSDLRCGPFHYLASHSSFLLVVCLVSHLIMLVLFCCCPLNRADWAAAAYASPNTPTMCGLSLIKYFSDMLQGGSRNMTPFLRKASPTLSFFVKYSMYSLNYCSYVVF